MNVLSLFDGISCGRIALERVGIKVDNYFASEIDKYAIKVAQKNYPNTIQLGDITKVHYRNGYLIWDDGRKDKYVGNIDLLIGGSPCQGFSLAGKQLNFDDSRSKLFFEFVRLLKECNPKYFLLENVRMKKEYKNIISEHLGVEPVEINSNLLSAQNRKRLYWTNISNITQPEDKHIYLKDILEENVDEKYYLSEKLLNGFKNNKEWYKRFKPLSGDDKSGTLTARYYKMSRTDPYILQRPHGVNKGGIKSINGKVPSMTTSAWEHNNLLIQDKVRRLTPIECERLQTLPDNYTEGISNTQRYKSLGNGWTVDVIVHILKNIKTERNNV